ncbi:MAG: hypothetical protein PF503_16290 [Desulfobacula sp.]|jgi:hypothetical protein|nr:hypothetical protein [Desulfobacula sp.]
MDVILIICTILGGLAAIWFFFDKARAAEWKPRPRPSNSPTKSASSYALASEKSSYPLDIEKFNFPESVLKAVDNLLPEYRVPNSDDLAGDWSSAYNSKTLEPFLCRGDFTGMDHEEYAFFVIGKASGRFKVVVLGKDSEGIDQVYHLTEGKGPYYNMYVFPISPGTYRISRIIWKHGGPKVLKLPKNGINVGTYESADCIYYWEENSERFVAQWMTD